MLSGSSGRFELTKPARIVIVIPALNEEGGIGAVLDEIQSVQGHGLSINAPSGPTFVVSLECAVVVVDGGSRDKTPDIVKSHGATLLVERKRGYGNALMAGFGYAVTHLRPDVIVMIDGDGTYDAEDIPRLVHPILMDEADMVLGNRFARMQPNTMTLTNRLGNRIISWLSRRFLGLNVSDTQSGLRALDADVVGMLNPHTQGMPFATEMLTDAHWAGFRIAEVPIVYRPRIGETKLNPLADGLGIAGVVLRLVRDYRPLLFFGSVGLMLAFFGMVLGLEVVFEWALTGSITRVPTALLTVLLIAISVQFLSLGLVADMVKDLRLRRTTEFARILRLFLSEPLQEQRTRKSSRV